uniref:Transmembrane protein 176B-like n=1 Tax=Neolamprologus brichardi TaxID=32507 RepID=A0A3Q4GCV9_NEOBR
MSVTVSKADGVTVLTLTSDPQSPWPPLCQIFKNLCYSPVCCTVSQHLRGLNRASQTVLGTLQIMIGLLNIGFGLILHSTWTSPYIDYLGFPFWLGALFIMFGIVCVLSEKYPSPCLVILTVILNLAGVAFAITAIVLYGVYLGDVYYWRNYYYNYYNYYNCYSRYNGYNGYNDETLLFVSYQMLLRSISAVMITLSVLELCVVISSAVLGIKALRNKEKGQNKVDNGQHKVLIEVTALPVV